MTTEDDFQRQLDACPDDAQMRLVFADWLQERGDERSEGYRALGANRLYAIMPGERGWGVWYNDSQYTLPVEDAPLRLPEDWFGCVESLIRAATDEGTLSIGYAEGVPGYWQGFNARFLAENAAALAFARLPAERRRQLLTVNC
jgi:uncharacterized protein (TIGR02996 family)